MKKSSLMISIVVVIVIAVVANIFLKKQSSVQYAAPTTQTSTSSTPSAVTSTSQGLSQSVNNPTPPSSVEVSYTDKGFSPSVVTVSKGSTVVFKNTASDNIRVSSNPHPVHNGYPTTGGCVGSTFDSCSAIAPGNSWSFTFTLTGKWGYHNHLNPSEGGTIIVQ